MILIIFSLISQNSHSFIIQIVILISDRLILYSLPVLLHLVLHLHSVLQLLGHNFHVGLLALPCDDVEPSVVLLDDIPRSHVSINFLSLVELHQSLSSF